MKKSKIIQKDYSIFGRNMQVKIENSLEKIIPSEESVRLLCEVMEELDYTKLYRAYSPKGRKPKTEPKTMYKLIIYGAMDGKYSSRELARACRRDINYMWLLEDEKAPNHSEIARFRSQRLPEAGEDLFYQLVKKLREIDEIKYEHLFVDGTKIEANANKYSFVWKKSTTKFQARLDKKIIEFTKEINRKHNENFTEEAPLRNILTRLYEHKTAQNIEFVSGRGKRKTELQKDIELLESHLFRQEKYEKYSETFGNRNSFSKTDHDATFMHMKEDHMRNAQLKPGYNVQLGVEGEYIVGVSVSSERSDQLTMIELLEQMERNLSVQYGDVTADAGYESEENYTYFEEKKQTCYIKPQNYERSKTRKFKSNMALRENMAYDQKKDEYTCQKGRKLTAEFVGKRRSKSGFESEITYYKCESCEDCEYKKNCTRAKNERQISVSKRFIEQREKSLENITSEAGILLRINRSIQVEGAFGVIKQDYGFRQFLLRGNKKVKTEIFIIAMAYNINKLHHKIQNNRTGSQLHEKNVA